MQSRLVLLKGLKRDWERVEWLFLRWAVGSGQWADWMGGAEERVGVNWKEREKLREENGREGIGQDEYERVHKVLGT